MVVVLFVFLAIALTWPVTERIDEVLIGDDYDVYINMWSNWWTQKAMGEGLDLYHTDYVFYPLETSLVFFSFSHTSAALWLLLAPVIGRIAAYNTTMLLAYALSGFSMYLLVRHLTDSRRAGFVAGLVFAFFPYHVYESCHPNLAAIQWMPLFLLCLHRVLYDPDASQLGLSMLGAFWFVMNALSGWHLMLLLAAWSVVYCLCEFCANRGKWVSAAWCRLILLAGFIAVSIAPFVWPIARDYLTTDTTFTTVEVQQGLGNDLLSFFVPHWRHPFLSSRWQGIHDTFGYAVRRPGYLGWAAIGLAIWSTVVGWSRSRSWLISGLVFVPLSLGMQVRVAGTPLFPFDLPWAGPIIKLLRHPYRLNTLVFLSIAVLVGFGAERLLSSLAKRSRILAEVALVLMSTVILFEYLVYPFPTTGIPRSPFVEQLSEEQGEFAVVDFPMGRQMDKRHMFYQTTHGKRIVGGHVSRPPSDTYAFVAGNPLLGPLLAGYSPNSTLDIFKELTRLGAQGIRYIILHKDLLNDAQQEAWRARLTDFPTPFYEDCATIVYRTLPSLQVQDLAVHDRRRLSIRIGDHIRLLGYRLDSEKVSAGGTVDVTLFWQSDRVVSQSYHVFIHLLNEHGELVAQHDAVPMRGALPTSSWWKGNVIKDEHPLVVDRSLPAGEYVLYAGMYELATMTRAPAVTSTGERLPNDAVLLQTIEVVHE